MDIIGAIAVATEGFKLANELRKIDKEWDKAELKLKLIEIADSLYISKQALQEAQERETELNRQVKNLEAKLAFRARSEDQNGLLYELNDDGKRIGEPFCNLCFVNAEKQFRMRRIFATVGCGEHYLCDHCKIKIILGPPKRLEMPPRGGGSWP